MSTYEVLVDGVCRYSGYKVDVALDAFNEYAKQVKQHGGYVLLLQDNVEIKAAGG